MTDKHRERADKIMSRWAEDSEARHRYPNLKEMIFMALAEVEAETRREDAELCLKIWKEAKNSPPHFLQNSIADGCLECEAAISGLLSTLPKEGSNG